MEPLISEKDRKEYVKKNEELSAMTDGFFIILKNYLTKIGYTIDDSQGEGKESST